MIRFVCLVVVAGVLAGCSSEPAAQLPTSTIPLPKEGPVAAGGGQPAKSGAGKKMEQPVKPAEPAQ